MVTIFTSPRSSYVAAWYAAKMMVPAKQGLIVNVSSAGGLGYLFNVAYGVGKAAVSVYYCLCTHCGPMMLECIETWKICLTFLLKEGERLIRNRHGCYKK